MSEFKDLITLLKQQHKEELQQQQKHYQQELDILKSAISEATSGTNATLTIPAFTPFDSTTEIWEDYWSRFCTFFGANSVPEERKAKIFLTNQTPALYKQLTVLASQMTPSRDINALKIEDIVKFMKEQYDPTRFIVRERFKFWSDMQRKPGETLQELAARIRQDAATCNFTSIKDPLDEALRQRFICSVNNEAILKSLFKIKDEELTFAKAVQIAVETEDAAKVAKETIYGTASKTMHSVQKDVQHTEPKTSKKPIVCYRCGKGHKAPECTHKSTTCNFCKTVGHLEIVCRKKQAQEEGSSTKIIRSTPVSSGGTQTVRLHSISSKLQVPVTIRDQYFDMEIDTGTTGNFLTVSAWEQLGKPQLSDDRCHYKSATNHSLPVVGTFSGITTNPESGTTAEIKYTVTKIAELNILGQMAIHALSISVDSALQSALGVKAIMSSTPTVPLQTVPLQTVSNTPDSLQSLQQDCERLCDDFPGLFEPGLGCLKDFELEVKFKQDTQPVFCKPRPVPFAIRDELSKGYDEGIAKGVWKPTQFNDYGTPVVPHRKAVSQPGQLKPKLRICGDYSTGINDSLEVHRQPMPLPEELMQRLGGGFGYTKVDLADAYNQIKLGPESQRRLALSTHRGVLLQQRLPFGIKSAPAYFQEIMEKLTKDLPGVAVYLDDILVSGKDAEDHLTNLRRLLTRLHENGLRCRQEKCSFAQASVEYLGHTLSREGICKGPKVDAVLQMPPPTDASTVRAFMGSVQFYGKFIPDLSTLGAPLNQLMKKGEPWRWTAKEQGAFLALKQVLSSDQLLVHFDPEKPVGLSCDASSVGIGAVLFHKYPDGSERPIANASKTLSKAEKNYSQIHKEALSIIFGLRKFYQFLFGRHFTLITDHKPLIALFSPCKGTPLLAANRLSRWALWLNQFDYSIQYRKTEDHGNADALSRLPVGDDSTFEEEESGEDSDMVCTIRVLSLQVQPFSSNFLTKESERDPVLTTVKKYVREGWPPKVRNPDDTDHEVEKFRKFSGSLHVCNGCVLHGSRVVIPEALRSQVMALLHTGHFGMERMKQLARTAVYWPGIDDAIEAACRRCQSCAEHQNKPAKPAIHPWMLPEKPWSRIHLDHAINFMGTNWLVVTDAYSKYPCIHPTSSVSTATTLDLLEEDCGHFGYPHTIVTDNAKTFTSEEFQGWCRERGIVHLTGAPYHPATNGSAERLVQSFKQSIRKSALPPKKALQEFLIQYRRTPTSCGYSPSELLNSRQIRAKIDALLPSPAHIAQGKQAREATKSQLSERQPVSVDKVTRKYDVGDTVYAEYLGPRRNRQPRWVAAVVTKRLGERSCNVKVVPRGPTWRRHIEQMNPRYASEEDYNPPEDNMGESQVTLAPADHPMDIAGDLPPQAPSPPEYTANNPRRSKRTPKPRQLQCCAGLSGR
jgi:transposase InsO family protein